MKTKADAEDFTNRLYLGVQYALYALDNPHLTDIKAGAHICHYHQNTSFHSRVDFVVHSIMSAIDRQPLPTLRS